MNLKELLEEIKRLNDVMNSEKIGGIIRHNHRIKLEGIKETVEADNELLGYLPPEIIDSKLFKIRQQIKKELNIK